MTAERLCAPEHDSAFPTPHTTLSTPGDDLTPNKYFLRTNSIPYHFLTSHFIPALQAHAIMTPFPSPECIARHHVQAGAGAFMCLQNVWRRVGEMRDAAAFAVATVSPGGRPAAGLGPPCKRMRETRPCSETGPHLKEARAASEERPKAARKRSHINPYP
jgi:hypothetical protein